MICFEQLERGAARGWLWWLGYLDTGAHDIVLDHAPKLSLYFDWHYVMVELCSLVAWIGRYHALRERRGYRG